MRLIITPNLESSLVHHPALWQGLQDWQFEVGSFLDAIGVVAQAELNAQLDAERLAGRMNLFISPPLTKFRIDKEDLFWQIKYFEDRLNLPDLDFIYGYGQLGQ